MKPEIYLKNAELIRDEFTDMLRNKPVESTLVERWQLIDKARELYGELPQPLLFGYSLTYILKNCSIPLKPYDMILGRFVDRVPTEEEEDFVRRFHAERRQTVMTDGGHITLDWRKIIRIGLDGYIAFAEAEYEKRLGTAHAKELVFYEGAVLALKAMKDYIHRYAMAAASAGMTEASENVLSVAGPAPKTFWGALQLVSFLEKIYYVYAGAQNPTLTLGRLDDILLDFYTADLESGRLTEEFAGVLIDDFYAKNNLILGRGEHQLGNESPQSTGWWRNNGYDDPTYVVLGGKSNFHKENPLTKLFASRINPRYENPVIIYRYTSDEGLAGEAWRIICDKLRQNASILVYNDGTMIPGFINSGIDEKDAIDYAIHGCNWPDIPAKYHRSAVAGGSIAKMIIAELVNLDGDKEKVRDYRSIDELYDAVAQSFRLHVRDIFAKLREELKADETALPEMINMTNIFTEGVLESGKTMDHGGVKYPVVYTLLRHIATAADIMTSLEANVFSGDVSLDEMLAAMKNGWEGRERLHKKCLSAPKFGCDNDYADKHAVRLVNMLLDIVDEEIVGKDGDPDIYSISVTITDMGHIDAGAELPASPDGRLPGAPLSENLSPTTGFSGSVTALLNSVAKLPFDRICSGALNVRLAKSVVSGDRGAEIMRILAKTYFEQGGMQIQVSVCDTAELRAAQEKPDEYRDLMVRITGYSAVFVDMCESAQDEFIRRDELS